MLKDPRLRHVEGYHIEGYHLEGVLVTFACKTLPWLHITFVFVTSKGGGWWTLTWQMNQLYHTS